MGDPAPTVVGSTTLCCNRNGGGIPIPGMGTVTVPFFMGSGVLASAPHHPPRIYYPLFFNPPGGGSAIPVLLRDFPGQTFFLPVATSPFMLTSSTSGGALTGPRLPYPFIERRYRSTDASLFTDYSQARLALIATQSRTWAEGPMDYWQYTPIAKSQNMAILR